MEWNLKGIGSGCIENESCIDKKYEKEKIQESKGTESGNIGLLLYNTPTITYINR